MVFVTAVHLCYLDHSFSFWSSEQFHKVGSTVLVCHWTFGIQQNIIWKTPTSNSQLFKLIIYPYLAPTISYFLMMRL